MEACFAALFPQEDTRRGVPSAQEFIAKTTQELQDARAMRGDRRSPGAAPHPGEDGGLHVCIDIPGLNRAASQELFWPSRVGCYEGPPHSYVHMPFGLPNVVPAHQCLLRSIPEAQEVRHQAVLAEMEMALGDPPVPRSLPRLLGLGVHEVRCPQRTSSATSAFLHLQHHQVTSCEFHF